jgi:predicted RNase H-like HicB family nuclease
VPPAWRKADDRLDDPERGVIVFGMTEKLALTISYDEPDEAGWIVARVLEVPGALSQGRTREEARENVIDALRLMLLPDDGDGGVADGRSELLELTLPG